MERTYHYWGKRRKKMALRSLSVSHLHVTLPQTDLPHPGGDHQFWVSDGKVAILPGLILHKELISNNIATFCSFVGGS